jgi:hypothetical protein
VGANRFFWPQELLDQWIVDEKIVLDGKWLTINDENRTYKVRQAVYFQSDVGDGEDIHGLIGRVKEMISLEEMGAEVYMDSAIIEDSAYEIVPGFTGEPRVVQIEAESSGAADLSGAIATQTGDEEETNDSELLAKFLIDNL